MSVREMRLVCVLWRDASATGEEEWHDLAELLKAHTPADCVSVGWVARDDDAALTLVPHLAMAEFGAEPDLCVGDMTIPRALVVSVHDLKLPRSAKP